MKIAHHVCLVTALIVLVFVSAVSVHAEVIIGLNYPKTGPYSVQGLDQHRAATLAISEINKAGGILGQKINLLVSDSKSKVDVSTKNVNGHFDKGAKMVFGGSASSVAIASGKVAEQRDKLFFGTLTYSTATTGKEGRKHLFRECFDAWMAAKAIGSHLKENFSGKKYFYITADYTWGHTTEASVRTISNTSDVKKHRGVKTPFPGAKDKDFKKALSFAKLVKPDVLVLVLFGKDMTAAVRIATAMGLKKKMQLVAPNLTLGMAEGGGAKVMEGVIGALPWTWKVPYQYNYPRGKKFVEAFAAKYNRYPSTSGASAYTILYEYKAAIERAKSFDTAAVIKALEGHKYTLLKDQQEWRAFDHQSIQTVYAVVGNPAPVVNKDKFKLDYFKILSSISGDKSAITRQEWNASRVKAGKPTKL